MAATARGLQLSRRRFVQAVAVSGFGLLAGCGRLPGQEQAPAAKVPRIGYLDPGSPPPSGSTPEQESLRHALAGFGYVAGQDITMEYRYAEGKEDQLPALAAELVHLPVDVMVMTGTPAVRAAKEATSTVPIVMSAVADAGRTGLVASLGRPGGNVTGISSPTAELTTKRMEPLREAIPGVSHVGVPTNPDNPAEALIRPELERVAQAVGVQLQFLAVHAVDDLDGAFDTATREQVDALIVSPNPLFRAYRARFVDLAAKHRIPAIYPTRPFMEAGGLMEYGPNYADMFRRTAYYVDRILKGAKPADLPVEQPTVFDFVINLKTAHALGLSIPQHVLLQATEVIQ
jgi:putative ABC transport system substrate-binding protein